MKRRLIKKSKKKDSRYIFCLIIVLVGFFSLVAKYMIGQKHILDRAGLISPVLSDTSHFAFLQSITSTAIAPDGENNLQRQQPSIDEVVFHGSRDVKQIALTFDADMTPGMEVALRSGRIKSYYDHRIIDILTRTHTKATLFLTGMWMEMYPDVAKSLAANALFELANHSYSHPSFNGTCYGLARLSNNDDVSQIEKTQSLLHDVTHVHNTFFRFPGGCYSQKNVDVVKHEGLTVIDWDVVGSDGFNNNERTIVENVLNKTQNGSIIVLHLMGYPNAPRTADALPEIVSTLQARGYEFVTVSDLLGFGKVSKAFDYRDYNQR